MAKLQHCPNTWLSYSMVKVQCLVKKSQLVYDRVKVQCLVKNSQLPYAMVKVPCLVKNYATMQLDCCKTPTLGQTLVSLHSFHPSVLMDLKNNHMDKLQCSPNTWLMYSMVKEPFVWMELKNNHMDKLQHWPNTRLAYAMLKVQRLVKNSATVQHSSFVHHCSKIFHKVGSPSHPNILFRNGFLMLKHHLASTYEVQILYKYIIFAME